jgi:hypothetical protein
MLCKKICATTYCVTWQLMLVMFWWKLYASRLWKSFYQDSGFLLWHIQACYLHGWIEFHNRESHFSQTADLFRKLWIEVVCMAELSFTIVKLNSARQRICLNTYVLKFSVWLNWVLRSLNSIQPDSGFVWIPTYWTCLYGWFEFYDRKTCFRHTGQITLVHKVQMYTIIIATGDRRPHSFGSVRLSVTGSGRWQPNQSFPSCTKIGINLNPTLRFLWGVLLYSTSKPPKAWCPH